jgi:hypothetical protein
LKQLWAAATIVALAAPARADDEPTAPPRSPDACLHDLVRDVRARIDAAIVARPAKPPKPVAVRWRFVKRGSFDLGAPLVALTGADLDRDGKGELYAVTSRDVIALGLRDGKLAELGRVALAGEPAQPMLRDVVATATADGNELVVAVSSWAKSTRLLWSGTTLAATLGDPGFLVCPGEVARLAPGRNYFGDATTGHFGVRCRAGLVEPDGRPLRVRAQLSLAGKLDIAVERCAAAGLGCQPATRYEVGNVGVAFDIADVDRDGRPEVVYAGAGAPGDPDRIEVVSLGDNGKKQAKLTKALSAGGVAGIGVTDLDGDGVDDVVAAVRLVGATRVDLWRLE